MRSTERMPRADVGGDETGERGTVIAVWGGAWRTAGGVPLPVRGRDGTAVIDRARVCVRCCPFIGLSVESVVASCSLLRTGYRQPSTAHGMVHHA